MTGAVAREREERLPHKGPHLSHSRLNRYLHCPEQYRLYYVENLRLRRPSANLIFGQIVHQALAAFFQTQDNPVNVFQESWTAVHDLALTYSQRDSWQTLRAAGETLLDKFVADEVPKIRNVEASEKSFELAVTGLDLPFVGVIDLVATFEGQKTVVDFKTSASSYQDYEVILSDQLTAYQMVEPEALQTALCVLVKTKAPKIEWHVAPRSDRQLTDYLAKAGLIAKEITSGHFYKRPGKWCSYCDYLPVCSGDSAKAKTTLIQIR